MTTIKAKTEFILYAITFVLITITIVGFMRCEHRFEKTTESIESEIDDAKITIEIESGKGDDANQATKPVSLGDFKLTAYCSCEECCGEWANNRPNGIVYGAIGEELKEGYSIAVDPDVIQYRTEVIINGKTYKAQDCGGGIKGNEIDIYFDNHKDALEFGVQYAEVFVKL